MKLGIYLTLALLGITIPTSTAQTCLKYNVLLLDVIYHDVCNRGSCMSSMTFMPDFDLPDASGGSANGYANGPRNINGYQQNFCAAITLPPNADGTPNLSLRPWGCDSAACSDNPACIFAGGVAGLAPGQVHSRLGTDDIPVFQTSRKPSFKKSIASNDTFWKWYHDSNATIRIDSQLRLTRQYDVNKADYQTFFYKNDFFFPLDEKGYANMGDLQLGDDFQSHNFGFTTHIHSDFAYNGGEHFTFQGDDDVWVFIDGHLAIDIGGVHDNQCRSIALDDLQNNGIGHVYNCKDYLNVNYSDIRLGEDFIIQNFVRGTTGHHLDIFHAERHYSGSHFAMSTSIALTGINNTGTDYTAPSALSTQLLLANNVTSIQLPTITLPGTSISNIPLRIPFPPYANTVFHCRILKSSFVGSTLNPTVLSTDPSTMAPPFNITQVLDTNNQVTWANVTNNGDYAVPNCLSNSADNPTWSITVTATAAGTGYLYCIAENSVPTSFNDYTTTGTARGITFYTKWVAAAITVDSSTTTSPPTTQTPTTAVPVTSAPTDSPTTSTPTTDARPTTPVPIVSSSSSTVPSPNSSSSTGSSSNDRISPAAATSSDLSSGAKAGLGIGITLGILIVLAIIGFFVWQKRAKKQPSHMEMKEPTTTTTPATTTTDIVTGESEQV